MGLPNSAKRARNYSQTITQNQGGGDSKAGLAYQVGRTAWTSIYLQCNKVENRCCSLKTLQFTANPNVRPSRPAGTPANVSYWH